MKVKLSLLFLLCLNATLHAQNMESEVLYPDTLRSTNDTVYFISPQWDEVKALCFLQNDSINWGTYGYRGVDFKVWTDMDTVTIPHVNHPYQQLVRIPLSSPRDTTSMVLRFQATYSSNFSDEYIVSNRQQIATQTSEVFELANIILFLSDCSDQTNNKPTTDYAQRVSEYFAPVSNHTLIKILNRKCEGDAFATYYGFRENSMCFEFQEDHLQYDTPYKHVFYDDSGVMGGYFRNMLYLVQDFAHVSKFRSFYKKNQPYYIQLEKRQSELLPIQKMWDWIETQFPQRMDSYKVIFSSLIEGTHSTQKFTRGFFLDPDYTECLMFINSPEYLDLSTGYDEPLKEGLMSGTVFTEIDHNYVNPTSSLHIEKIKDLIQDKDVWATKQAQRHYKSEYAIFNEYMTHSVFCLYASDNFEAETADKITSMRIQLMKRRGYPKFEAFNSRLMEVMKDSKKNIYESYPIIIEKMKSIE